VKKRKENLDKVQNLQPKIIEAPLYHFAFLSISIFSFINHQKITKFTTKQTHFFRHSLCKTIFHPDEQSEACSISFRTVQKKIRQKARSFLDLLSDLLQAQH